MMSTWAAVFGPVLALLLVAGSAATVAATPAPSAATTAPGVALVTDAVSAPASVVTHALPASTPLSLSFTLNNPDSEAITQFLAQVEDPAAPGFHHFLTFSQYLQRFAPPESQTRSVVSALEAAGGHDLSTTPDRSSVNVVLSAGAVEQLLGVRLVEYPFPSGGTVYTAVGSPSLPASLAGLVGGVGGLSNRATAEFASESARSSLNAWPSLSGGMEFAHDNTTGENWFVGSDFTQEYGATELFPGPGSVPAATYPTSVAVATLLLSAYNTTYGELPPWDPTVIDTYLNGTLGPGWPISNVTGVPVTLAGDTPPLPGSFGPWTDSSPYEYENSLDLEMAGSLAPGASLYNFYFGASLVNGSTTSGDLADDFAWDLAAALGYPYAPQHLAAVSCSFGTSVPLTLSPPVRTSRTSRGTPSF
jgi:subtilase family serine protease